MPTGHKEEFFQMNLRDCVLAEQRDVRGTIPGGAMVCASSVCGGGGGEDVHQKCREQT